MEFITTPLEGLVLIMPKSYSDDRGCFLESFNEKLWQEHALPHVFLQDNQSFSRKGVIRGLHFQLPPYQQGKLVRVVHGRALDVVVDLRRESSTYGRHFAVELNPETNTMLWIPPGFAHGFESLEENTVFLYKVTAYYRPEAEAGIRFDDPALGIPWRTSSPIVSKKDLLLPSLAEWMASN